MALGALGSDRGRAVALGGARARTGALGRARRRSGALGAATERRGPGAAPAHTRWSYAVFVLCGVEGWVGPLIHPRIWTTSRVRCGSLSSAARLLVAVPCSGKVDTVISTMFQLV